MTSTDRRYFTWLNGLLIAAAVGVIVLCTLGLRVSQQAVTTSQDLFRTTQARVEIRELRSALKDAETGERGFLITGDDRYLAPYHVGVNQTTDQLRALKRLVKSDFLTEEQLAEITTLTIEKLDAMESTIQARREGTTEEAFLKARNLVVTDRGNLLMEQLRDLIGDLLADRDGELQRLQVKAVDHESAQTLYVTLGLVLTLGTFIAAGVFSNLERVRRERMTVERDAERTRLAAIVNSALDGIISVDADANVIMMNPAAELLFGLRERDLLGQSITRLLPQDFHESALNRFHSFSQSDLLRKRLTDAETIFAMRRDGSEFPVEASISKALVNDQYLFTIMLRDVSEREQGRNRIREQAEILSRIRDSVHVRDLENRIQFWNKGAEKLYGWKSAEAIGKISVELLRPESSESEPVILKKLLRHGAWVGERSILTRDDRPLIVESRRSLILDKAGHPTSQLVIDIDVTEDKRRELTARRSQRLESIGTLASGIAHDLNNVLTPITMGTRLLKRTSSDTQRDELISTIITSAERGAAMVQQLLAFAGGTHGPREWVDIPELLDEACAILRHTLPKSVTVTKLIGPDIWTVLGDPTELSQVLMNLSINARDAMPDGGTLTFEAKNTTLDRAHAISGLSAGNYVQLSVADTGTGMSLDVVERIFDPFFTTKEQGKGTGLGLATCMGIVNSHDGGMSVYSEVGRGTTFTIYLPSQESTPALLSPTTADLPSGNGRQVLVIDDEEAVLQMAHATLEAYGFRSVTAISGAQAVSLFARLSAEIDAIIVDMMMPEMDGPATIQALKAICSTTPIIASSGLRKPESGASSIAGSNAFLPKPYSDEALLRVLDSVLM